MRFRGNVEAERVTGALRVPTQAVFLTSEGPIAYRRTPGGFERRRLELGRAHREYVEVLSGLGEGDEVSAVDLDPERGAT
jgi:multidrug efflux pump subunit AcrA (membrane-fusion protein)